MRSSENEIIIACAGSGKTSRLVHDALSHPDRRIAIITYTNNNLNEIASRFNLHNSGIPKNVELLSWFSFLLRECVRPYQRFKYSEQRIEAIAWVQGRSPYWIRESNVDKFYLVDGNRIYQDKLAQFVIECERLSKQRLTQRLRKIYTDLFIDEFQDLSGYDLEIVETLLKSDIRVMIVGDPRQSVYKTNNSAKNAKYRKAAITKRVEEWEKAGLCSIESLSGSYRCNGMICAFASKLWPGMDEMQALTEQASGHDGVFVVDTANVHRYIATYSPQVLRWDKNAESYGCQAINFGKAKGLQFDRVLITPTQPIAKYLKTGDLKYVESSREKLHVAITRARFSVAFAFDGHSEPVPTRWCAP